LVYRPSLLLLDEPLSSLDNLLKSQLLDMLLRLQEEFSTALVYVTHDEREAVRLATQIAVIDGETHELRQWGPAEEVFSKPATPSIARLLGGWNILTARYDVGPPGLLSFGERAQVPCAVPLSNPDGALVDVGLPINAVRLGLASSHAAGVFSIPIRVRRIIPLHYGRHYECAVEGSADPEQRLLCFDDSDPPVGRGTFALALFEKERLHVFTTT
jgi:ABC-type Fe3+/spermidine/putrescine transport system ATPase subunit